MSSLTHRTQVLAAYKELIRMIRRLPVHQHSASLDEARQTLRSHKDEEDPALQLDLLKKLCARVSFLRTITPRQPGDAVKFAAGNYVLRGGDLVEGHGSTSGNRVADGTISMSEAREKHQQLLRRQHFGREPPPYSRSNF